MTESASRVAFVTGAGQGLGRAIADALSAAGHSVCYGDIDGDKAAEAARTAPRTAIGVALDVRDKTSIAAAAKVAEDTFGRVSILVNNAARTVARPFFELEAEEWDDVLSVNLRGVLLTSQVFVPDMLEAGWGRVINLSSLAGQRGGPQVQGAHYASSKAGIIGLTRYMAHEFAPKGVTVNCIAPGPILTEATALAPPDKLAMVASAVPVGRIGEASEVGDLATYLASDSAGFLTGTTTDINGGLQMR